MRVQRGQHAAWLYQCFRLSPRDVGDLLAERELNASYATIRRRVTKFGTACTKRLRQRYWNRVPLRKAKRTGSRCA